MACGNDLDRGVSTRAFTCVAECFVVTQTDKFKLHCIIVLELGTWVRELRKGWVYIVAGSIAHIYQRRLVIS